MITVVLIAAGLVIGITLGRDDGWLWGALIGYLLARVIDLTQRVGQLETRLRSTTEAVAEPKPDTSEAVLEPLAAAPEESAATEPQVQIDSDELLAQAREAEPPPQPTAADGSWAKDDSELPTELPPREPNLVERGIAAAWRFFTTGNPMVRVGALVTIVGVAFLLKYMAERVEVPIGMRLLGISVAGLAMVGFGFWLRGRRPGFALPFQGAGLGVLYLTCFASFRLYDLLPPTLAFGLLCVLAVATIVLAVMERALVLAAFGVAGGFLAPVLASTGSGSHVELFGFYLVLNIVIAILAWFQSWRILNWIGFVFTFGIASLWGANYYAPAYFATTEPFLLAHTALYIAIAVLFAQRQPPALKGLVDGTLVFGTPLIAFALQASMLEGQEGPLALSAAGLGSVYLLLWAWLRRRDATHFGLLAASFLALGIGFLTLAVPLAFDARVTSATWCLEGAAIVWVSLRQESWLRRAAGLALAFLGSLAFFLSDTQPEPATVPFLDAEFIGAAIIGLVFTFMAAIQRHGRPAWLPPVLALYGFAWWTVGGISEVEASFAGVSRLPVLVAYFAISAFALAETTRRLRWSAGQYVAALLAICCGAGALSYPNADAPVLGITFWGGLAGAAAVIGVGRWLLREAYPVAPRWVANGLGVVGLVVWVAVGQEATRDLTPPEAHHVGLLWVSLSIGAAYWLHRVLDWPEWRWAAALHLLVPAAFLAESMKQGWAPTAQLGWFVWPAVVLNQYHLLRAGETRLGERGTAAHAISWWTLLALAGWATLEVLEPASRGWQQSLPALAVLLAAGSAWLARGTWPVRRHPEAFQGRWLLPVAGGFSVWLLAVAVAQPGSFEPLPQLALLNPLDLTVLAVLLAMMGWWHRCFADQSEQRRVGLGAIAVLIFGSLNALALRAVHVHLDVPWSDTALWESFAAQASVTTLWTVTALALMIAGARAGQRALWVIGAWVMGAAVLKLFVVDTAGTGTLARVIAFFVVAAGLFLGGYFVPKPPSGPTTTPSTEPSAS